VAEYFLEHGYDPGAGDGKALVASAHGCDWPMFRFLASRTNNLSSLLWTPLMRAIILGNSEDVVNELERAPDLISKDANERTAFMLSVCSGDVEKMKLVYAAGGALSDRGHCEESVLDCAIISRSPEMLRGLLDLGVDPNLAGVLCQTALMSAVENSNLEAIRILLDYGADVSCIDDCGQKLVNFATDVGCMKLLVELGADPDYIDGTGMFPLKAAVEDGNVELVRCLIGLGANVNNQRFGLTALQQATNYDHLEIMKILLEAGANPNAAENDVGEWMPLWWAKSREAAQILIDGGASLVLCDAFGKNAYLHHSTAEFRDILKPN
ncbi:MAG: ankyrin repeat domain-containing protein, partial [Cyanobacteria bacterium SZAS LIN-2]|nr:ankyrin repeat domain-containing protein [Cyanobacteria bacterium SZAS LIN-2]